MEKHLFTKKEATDGGFECSRCGWKPCDDWEKNKKKVWWRVEANGIGYCADCDSENENEDNE